MRLFDKYLLPPRSPDEPAAPEPAPGPVLAPEPALEPGPEPAPEPAPQPQVQERTVPLKVMLERIGEESTKRQAEAERARLAEERAASLEAIVQRMQTEPKPGTEPAPRTVVPEPVRPKVADQTEVDQAAARMLLARDLRNVSDHGLKTYGTKWGDAVNALNALGANSEDFVASVMEIDPTRTHEIMFEISQDPERAVSLVRMSPAKRIAEITRMVMAKAEPAPKTDPTVKTEPEPKPAVSRAPAPKPAIAPLASAPEVDPTTPEGNDKMSDKEWEAWFKNKHYKKSA